MKEDVIKNIMEYGNASCNYVPFVGGVFYPVRSQEFVRTGFMSVCPALSARDYKDPKCVVVEKK